MILNAIQESNDTLGDLGNLDESTFMGVRIREELRQAIKLNNSSTAKKNAHHKDRASHVRSTNVDTSSFNPTGQGKNSMAVVSSAE